ncbi:MAG: T9SS type A sorting domain-containing protein [Chitinophagaceae bacterium]|nr:MAG: T9SS type A sorting domain-containing protein [Chitinophagaceae bacterium]
MRAIFVSAFLLLTAFVASAQRMCLTDDRTVAGESTSMLNMRDTLSDEVIRIPVVIHILYNRPEHNISDAQVISQINALNRDFRMANEDASMIPAYFRNFAADVRVEFCIAKVDPMGRNTNGIIRKQTSVSQFMGDDGMKFNGAGGSDAWDSRRYLNIWVCNMFGRALGYATMPGTSPDRDGVVINWDVFGTTGNLRAPFTQGRTTTHEVAHWMGLKHIWGDAFCGSDDVDDTPQQESYNFYCPTFPRVSSCSPNGNGDMYMNFMDLTDDACMLMFTHGQKRKMRGVFAASGLRNNFLQSYACDSTNASAEPLPAPAPAPEAISGSLKIYPNPVVDFVNVEAVQGFVAEGKVISMFDLYGRQIRKVKMNEGITKIDCSNLSRGIYILKVGDGKSGEVFRIVKQ